ncbi:uncharacterized protein PAC_07890 [Phialocephala subalpina]|uniref:F-box domain-containing protein n=1 Tax=Phialocephala subalpina TaxID=576137 RepID=A0A1L7WZ21_9HELO|nr:uncharacterized protein PAC_07890 [Phialocephala subalpina]
MSTEAPSMTTPDNSDTLVDLNTVFSHPAGLRAARYIVRTYINAANAENILPSSSAEDTTPSEPIQTSELSPEVASLLQTILSLNDSEVQRSDGDNARLGEFTMEGQHGTEKRASNYLINSKFACPDLQIPSSHDKQIYNHLLSPTPSPSANQAFNFSKPIPPSLTNHPRSDLESQSEMTSRLGLSGSSAPGSPFRIETPLRTSTNTTPQPQSMRAGEASLPAATFSYDLFASANGLPPAMRKSLSSDLPRSSASVQRNAGSSSSGLRQTTSQSSNTPPTMKTFLPVNKTDGNGGAVAVKTSDHSLFADSCTTSAHRLIHSASSQHSQSTHHPSLSSRRPFSATMQAFEMERTPSTSSSQKRKGISDQIGMKKQKTEKGEKRIVKIKEPKPPSAASKLGPDLWMRILEFAPTSFIRKARVINKDFKLWIDSYSSIYVNQRIENYGEEMPPAAALQVTLSFEVEDTPDAANTPDGEDADTSVVAEEAQEAQPQKLTEKKPEVTERQYNDLLGGKGCLADNCTSTKDQTRDEKCSRTHWSWCQRWCQACWSSMIIREDRVLKSHQNLVGRQVLQDLLACIPNGMHDSFMKPHDYVTEEESRDRARGAPRLYRYYLLTNVDDAIAEYKKRTPPPYVDDPTISAAANASAKAVHQIKETALTQKRQDWLEKMKAKNAKWMETVKKIEGAVRMRRNLNGVPNEDFRKTRKELFTRRAKEDLPHIPTEFVQSTKHYKAATRIFRDGGTERGWQTLKPKIEKAWREAEQAKEKANGTSAGAENADGDDNDDGANDSLEVEAGNRRPMMHQQAYLQMIARQNPSRQQQGQMSQQHSQLMNQRGHMQMQQGMRTQSSHPGFARFSANHQQPASYQQLPGNLDVLAHAATNDFASTSSFGGYGDMTSYQTHLSSADNSLFATQPMRFTPHTLSQHGYGQFSQQANAGGMFQPSVSAQEPARNRISVNNLLNADQQSSSSRREYNY